MQKIIKYIILISFLIVIISCNKEFKQILKKNYSYISFENIYLRYDTLSNTYKRTNLELGLFSPGLHIDSIENKSSYLIYGCMLSNINAKNKNYCIDKYKIILSEKQNIFNENSFIPLDTLVVNSINFKIKINKKYNKKKYYLILINEEDEYFITVAFSIKRLINFYN